MNLTLSRTEFADDGVFGELLNGLTLIAATLEHSYDKIPKLPAGFYTCRRGMHRLEGMDHDFETFEIGGVPGHTNILFHTGNWNKDSAGCVLLGSARSGNMLIGSRTAFNKFMDLQQGVNEFTLQVVKHA